MTPVPGSTVIEEDTLFLACTRPIMVAGVTMEAMAINMMLTTTLFILAGSIVYACIGAIFHLLFKALVKHDHNMFRVMLAWVETRGRARNLCLWGGSTVTPLRLHRHYDGRDLNLD